MISSVHVCDTSGVKTCTSKKIILKQIWLNCVRVMCSIFYDLLDLFENQSHTRLDV